MEKFYIVTNKKYLAARKTYIENARHQRSFINKILEDNGIDGERYILGGDGVVNAPFLERNKEQICLSIEATDNNLEKFGSQLKSKREYYPECILVGFKRNSKIMKAIQQQCIEEQVIINLDRPRVGNYIKELSMGGYSYQVFEYKGNTYMKLTSDKLTSDIAVEGFDEIKGSEFFKMLEEFESETK